MIVGLTGGIGSGKTTVANLFLEFKNVVVYFADMEAKKLMNSSINIKQSLKKEFGKESYNSQGLNRKHIADIVFRDKKKLQVLNAIVHPEVKSHFQEFIKNNKDKDYIIYENAILFESKSNLLCDLVISVFVTKSVRIQRVMLRDKCSKLDAENRINNQWLEDKKTLQSNYLVENFNLNETQNQVKRIHNFLTKNKRSI
jgi:dephospho-CoA kinase